MTDYRKYLTQDILPFWIKHGIDTELGGIYTQLDKCGNILKDEKSVWFAGRSLWTFAHAYNTIEAKKEYLDVCEKLCGFLEKCTLANGRLPYLTKKDGQLIENRESFHSEAFACIACAQYYKATKREDLKKKALEYFDIVYRIYKEKTTTTTIICGHHCYILGAQMMMLNVCQFMRNAAIYDIRFEETAKEAVENITNYGFIDDKNKRIKEYAICDKTEDISVKNDYACFGHLYETAWFLLCEGEIKNDDAIRETGKKFIDYALLMEDDKGAIPVRTSNTGCEYIWWPQCEALAAYALGYNIFGESKYRERFDSLFNFVMRHFADKENGEWYTACSKDGEILNTNKGSLFKGPFHLPRMLMALISLEETGSILKYIS